MVIPPGPMANVSQEQIRAIQRKNEKNQEILYHQLKQYDKPLVYIRRMVFHFAHEPNEPASPPKATIPEYTHPRRAARVLRYLAGYRQYLESKDN
jgi:hypothetical protein